MPLAIDEAAVRIRGIQKGLAITHIVEFDDEDAPVQKAFPLSIKRAYPYFPKSSMTITDTPCFINQWVAPEVSYRSGVVIGNFSMHMRLLVKDADTDRAATIASAFYTKIVEAFGANVKLGAWGPATVLALRGLDPTLTPFEFAGEIFIGLDLLLDLHLNTAMTMEP